MPDVLAAVMRRVLKLETDMYFGDGKENPSMTTRVAELETCMERMAENSKLTRRMMMATMCTVVGGIAVELVRYLLGVRP